MLSAAKLIAQKIYAEKAKHGRLPWGFASQLLKQGRECFLKCP